MSIKKIILSVLLLGLAIGGFYAYQFYQKMQPTPLAISIDDRKAINLMPLPTELKLQKTGEFLELTEFFGIEIKGAGAEDGLLKRAVRRMKKRIGDLTEQTVNLKSDKVNFIINCKTPISAVQGLKEDESYTLNISKEKAVLEANTVYGALRGIETALQLLFRSNERTFMPTIQIKDSPRYPYRGLMIDVARHFIPKKVILQNLDAMAAVKLNVLHLHLTDYQGFRVESKVFPKLHKEGANGQYYTQKDVQEIVKYAKDRGIRVIPEFDLPGHSTSFLVGYPELAAAPGPYQLDTLFGILNPVIDPSKEGVYTFLDDFFGEMALLFPDEYVHIGGDEVHLHDWENSTSIAAFMDKNSLKDYDELLVYFNQRVQKILTKHGKKMMGWDEISHPDLGKEVVIQSWRGHKTLFAAARNGNPTILSTGLYLDHKLPAGEHYKVNPAVIPNAVSIEPDSLHWKNYALKIKVGESPMESNMILYGTEDNLRGAFSMVGNLTPFENATLKNDVLAFTFESAVGKINFEGNLLADNTINGTMSLGLMNITVEGTQIGGNDMEGTTAPPLEKIEPLTPEQEALILGAEACMWSEVVDAKSINFRIWPRMAAIAERFWSPADLANDEADMYRRLAAFEVYLKEISFNVTAQYMLRIAKLTEKNPIFLQQAKDLIDHLEEVKYYNRMAMYDNLSTNTPLNEVADIALPESPTAKQFNQFAAAYATDPGNQVAYNELKFKLGRLIENHQLLKPMFDNSPALKKVENLSLQLRKASEVALICLEKRNGNGLVTEEEQVKYRAIIAGAEPAQAGVEIAIIKGLKQLIEL